MEIGLATAGDARTREENLDLEKTSGMRVSTSTCFRDGAASRAAMKSGTTVASGSSISVSGATAASRFTLHQSRNSRHLKRSRPVRMCDSKPVFGMMNAAARASAPFKACRISAGSVASTAESGSEKQSARTATGGIVCSPATGFRCGGIGVDAGSWTGFVPLPEGAFGG